MLEQISAAEATRFRHAVSIDAGPVVEIGNGARHAQQLKAAARAQPTLVDQLFPELECRSLDGSGPSQRCCRQPPVAVSTGIAPLHPLPGSFNLCGGAPRRCTLRWAGLLQHRSHLLGGAPFQPQLQIEPIQERAGEPLPGALALADAAATAMVAVAMPAAGAGICSCLLYTSPSPRDATLSRMPSSA